MFFADKIYTDCDKIQFNHSSLPIRVKKSWLSKEILLYNLIKQSCKLRRKREKVSERERNRK
jgi:hypothetical protein